ncbi:hypothetical protein [Saccharibacillus brassicae]|uniref:Uncharacterized protein n=1 Tax=Saccharibacillus brassicae TaxID=2583377 RepID=A0A4Y6V5B4_SACBS|nr:hypothetical protein [Saccharibacillus brassicae]QDH23485.1 hypothetical protein FFV09_23035 [Saccharibacillus brassicae]
MEPANESETIEPKIWREDMLTPEQAEFQISGYEEVLASSMEDLANSRRQIAEVEKQLLKGKKIQYTEKDLEYFKERERWCASDVKKLERELNERRLLVSGWTWKQIYAQRQPAKEPDELTLF